MKKKGSLFLGRYSGIGVFVHWTFLILIFWIFLVNFQMGSDYTAGLWGVLFILALFVCVILHEFGHALTAQRYNIQTRDVTIYPIGGIASLEKLPDEPGQELLIAIAGPAVNVVIAILLWLGLRLTNSMPVIEDFENVTHMQQLPFAYNLLAANILLVVFNLLPAFPMDGGRVLRALLAFKMNRVKATKIAAGVGQLMAVIFVLLGFYYSFWLVFIGLFVYIGATGEAKMEEQRAGLRGVKVADVLMRRFSILRPDEPLSRAVALMLDGQERSFIIQHNNEVLGVLSKNEIIAGLSLHGDQVVVGEVMLKDVPHLHTDDDVNNVMMELGKKRYSLLPVFENSHLVGVVDIENVSEFLQVQQALRNQE